MWMREFLRGMQFSHHDLHSFIEFAFHLSFWGDEKMSPGSISSNSSYPLSYPLSVSLILSPILSFSSSSIIFSWIEFPRIIPDPWSQCHPLVIDVVDGADVLVLLFSFFLSARYLPLLSFLISFCIFLLEDLPSSSEIDFLPSPRNKEVSCSLKLLRTTFLLLFFNSFFFTDLFPGDFTRDFFLFFFFLFLRF